MNNIIKDKNGKTRRNVEAIYKKKSHHEHILDESDSYIGSKESFTEEQYVYDDNEKRIVKKSVTYTPGLVNITNEFFVNGRDHGDRDSSCDTMRINVDRDANTISVYNNGSGIPVEMHKEHGIYIPELIFGHLLTSSNYYEKGKTVGGKNGYGAKVGNIFSTKFIVETIDANVRKKYVQVFENNMYTINKPTITDVTKKDKPYTKITFTPDLKRFNLTELSDDFVSILKKRAHDISACTNGKMSVYFNDELLSIKSFEDYIKLYYPDGKLPSELVYEEVNDRWKVGVLYDTYAGFQQISFVNGIHTGHGGTHVKYIVDQIIASLTANTKKKCKDINIKPQYIKENLTIFIDSVIEDPNFESQTKELLKKKVSEFGSKCELSEKFISKLIKTGICNEVLKIAENKDNLALKKVGGTKTERLKDIPKLDDAEEAGKRNSRKCRLILTEGDSAKKFAVDGINHVGNKYYGVFPLRGKLLNVRDVKPKDIQKNEEIVNIMKIMGLKIKTDKSGNILKSNVNINKLRYGGVIILTDQDSVSADTPLLLRKNNMVDIKTIDDISNDWNLDLYGKEYGDPNNYEVWTDEGWTKIKHVMRHKVTKKMYRVLTHSGVVDVTEDHSLLDKNGEKIAPKDCNVDEDLLHSFPKFEDTRHIILNYLNELSQNGVRKYANRLNIQCCNKKDKSELVNLINNINNEIHLDLNIDSKITLEESYDMGLYYANGNMSTSIHKFKNLFYNRNKNITVPNEILNSPFNVREHFFRGFYDGNTDNDCKKDLFVDEYYKSAYFHIHGKIKTQGMYFICKSLGYNVSITCSIDKPEVYKLNISTDKLQCNPNRIKEIIDLGTIEQYVYDLETENHHFQAGVGQLIVHNTDGSHIKGLIMNFIYYFWPNLLKQIGFIQSIITPIIRAFKGKKGKGETITFNTMSSFKQWQKTNPKGWTIKYYKGLGTSTKEDAIEVFSELEKRQVDYVWELSENVNDDMNNNDNNEIDTISDIEQDNTHECCDAINLAFCKKRANDRKDFITDRKEDDVIDYDQGTKITFRDFVYKDFVHFSYDDVKRSLPAIDGFKESQRKVMYGCLTNNKMKNSEIKVSQLAGYIAEHTEYHHGEANLFGTIIKMAQDFKGSNNINLLMPNGNFGSYRDKGKDAAQPRYIYTEINPITHKLFRKEDEKVYDYIFEENIKVEPALYCPIIPTILINGKIGIGTGFSTNIPMYNPIDICENIINLIEKKKQNKIYPWYLGFKGKIEKITATKFKSHGIYTNDDKFVYISELPIGMSIEDYKDFLEKSIVDQKSPKKNQFIEYYDNRPSNDNVDVTIKFYSNYLQEFIKKETLEESLKLVTTINTTNMWLFDHKGELKKYYTPEEIIEDFYEFRYNMYHKRKEYYTKILEHKCDLLKYKKMFIEFYLGNKITIDKTTTEMDVIKQIEDLGFPKLSANIDDDVDDIDNVMKSKRASYNYLTEMKIFSLTKNRIEELEKDLRKIMDELDDYKNLTIEGLWKREIDEFLEIYIKYANNRNGPDKKLTNKMNKSSKTKKTKKQTKNKKMF